MREFEGCENCLTPGRWEQVAKLFEEALEKPAPERSAFVRQASGDDTGLRREVEEMLRCHDATGEFLDRPVLEESDLTRSTTGIERIANFRVIEKIGEGGMGTVYKAEDLTLGRTVAIKVLSKRMPGREAARARFLQEARAASALDHPNICTIYEVEETEGRLAIIMAYYDGETLRQRLARGALSPREATRLILQAAHGLSAAHGAGIVHRDVKPANLMVTRDGVVKILDFGIAKVAAAKVATTEDGNLGTLAYMSPEQARGELVDHRVDVWSLGVVFYELLTGSNPFRRENHLATMNAILYEDATPTQGVDVGLPLWPVLGRALQKDPSQRYNTMGEFAAVLEAMWDSSDSGSSLETFRQLKPAPSVAVLPFSTLSGEADDRYFAEGLTEDIAHAITSTPGIRLVSRAAALQAWGTLSDPREIGRKLNVATVVEGSVRKAGNRVRVTAHLINVADGYQLWSGRFDREITDILALQDEIAQSIAGTLVERLQPGKESAGPAVVHTPTNPEAYEHFMRGRFYMNQWTPASLDLAFQEFERTVQVDSTLAQAHHHMARVRLTKAILGFAPPKELLPPALEAAQRAVSLAPDQQDIFVTDAIIYGLVHWDWKSSREAVKEAYRKAPGERLVVEWYCEIVLMPAGKFDDAMALLAGHSDDELAAMPLRLGAVWLPMWMKDPERSIRVADRALALSPAVLTPLWIKGLSWHALGKGERALEAFEAALSLDPTSTITQGLLATCLALHGRYEQAVEALTFLEDLRQRRYVAPSHMSWPCAALGDLDRAFRLLEEARDQRDFLALYLDTLPMYAPLRSDDRYVRLQSKLQTIPE